MQYHFNIVTAESAYKDDSGEFFYKDEHATARAAVIAHEYSVKGGWDGWAVQVVDAHGTEIARLLIGPKAR
jgi:hypothetical protein